MCAILMIDGIANTATINDHKKGSIVSRRMYKG
jgi:hypothetical protein